MNQTSIIQNREFLLIKFLFFYFLIIPFLWAKPQYASIVVDGQTGKIIHAIHHRKQVYPASLTKKMTLYLIFQKLRSKKLTLDTPLTMSAAANRQMPSRLDVKTGETITVRQAIYALIVKSANNVAYAIAENLSKTKKISDFIKEMNHTAQKLGMLQTKFYNPSGVPDPRQVTTAYDMIVLARALHRDFPEYYHLFKMNSFKFKGRTYRSHNHLLGKVPGVDGLKTGFINASGFNISTSAVRNYGDDQKPFRIFAVVMGGPSWQARDRHTTQLIRTALSKGRPVESPAPNIPEKEPEIILLKGPENWNPSIQTLKSTPKNRIKLKKLSALKKKNKKRHPRTKAV